MRTWSVTARGLASVQVQGRNWIVALGRGLEELGRVEELARLGGFERLRDLGIPEEAPAEVAETVSARAGAQANPRPVTPADVEELIRAIW